MRQSTGAIPLPPRSGTRVRLALLLMLPVVLVYAGHLAQGLWGDRGGPTGFLNYEGRYYVANAREHSDAGAFHFAYGNPCSPDADTPRIYAQPLSLLLGVVLHFIPVDPGLAYACVGLLAAAIAVWLAVLLWEARFGLASRGARLGLVVMVWGGGLFALPGLLIGLLAGGPLRADHVFLLDPFQGWWCQNLGRNLIMPTEATYHALALGALLAMVRGRPRVALVLLAVLSASHPFTGLQLLLVAVAFTLYERVFRQRREMNGGLVITALLLAAHVGYYLGGLPRWSPEHQVLTEQWALPWTQNGVQLALAYGLVGGLALWRLRTTGRAVLQDPIHRLLLVLFAVSFLLANHDLLIEPIQPLHFTHGYVWSPLYLLGAPVLVRGIDRLAAGGFGGRAAALAAVALLLFDNAAWMSWQTVRQPEAVFLPADDRAVLSWLAEHCDADTLVVADSRDLAYSAIVYSRVRTWSSHMHVTPQARLRQQEVRAWFEHGSQPAAWQDRDLVVIRRKERSPLELERTAEVREIGQWVVVRRRA